GRHTAASVGGNRERRRFLHHLLMTPLDGTLALDKRHDSALGIAEQLDFYVPRPMESALEVDRCIAERRTGLRPGGADGAAERVVAFYDAHSFATASGNGFDQQRISKRGCRQGYVLIRGPGVEGPFGTRHDSNARAHRHTARRRLAAHERDRFRRGSDKGETGVAAGAGK